jgi:hypothetical protein
MIGFTVPYQDWINKLIMIIRKNNSDIFSHVFIVMVIIRPLEKYSLALKITKIRLITVNIDVAERVIIASALKLFSVL